LEAQVVASAPEPRPAARAKSDPDAPVQVPTVGGRRTTPGSASEPKLNPTTPTSEPATPSAPAQSTPSRVKARAWGAATRVLPQGSRPRAAARASVLALRETRKAGRQMRRVFAEAGVIPESVSYRAWCKDHDVDQKQLKAQRA